MPNKIAGTLFLEWNVLVHYSIVQSPRKMQFTSITLFRLLDKISDKILPSPNASSNLIIRK